MWHRLFLEKLLSGDVRAAQDIKASNLPKSIFKYRAINPNSISNFRTNTMWVSSVDKFPDPYDCFFMLSVGDLNSEFWSNKLDKIKSKLLEICEKNNRPFDRDAINKAASFDELAKIALFIDGKLSTDKHNTVIDAIKTVFKNISDDYQVGTLRNFIRKNMGVCSFSETNLSLIMWRYYGDNHKGFCLEYDLTMIKKDSILANCLFPVIYISDIPDMTPYYAEEENKFNNLIGVVAAMHKSEEWDHEKEWRIILPLGEKYCAGNFSMPKPKAIHIGLEAAKDEKDKKILLDIAVEEGIEAQIMQFRSDSYQLTSVPVK
jgi:hypothetical protein